MSSIFLYPVTITYEELKNETGIELNAEYAPGEKQAFMNKLYRSVYDGGIYATGASDIKDRIINANEACKNAIKRALLIQAEYLLDVGDAGTDSGITISEDGQKAVISRKELRSKSLCTAAVDALKACPVPIMYAGEDI